MAYLKVEKGETTKAISFGNLSRRQIKNRIDKAVFDNVDLKLRDHDGDYYIFESNFISYADLITIGGSDDTSKN